MKMKIVNNMFKVTLLVLMAAMVMVSCKKDEEEDPPPPVVVLDGYYVMGAGTGANELNDNGIMSVARNEVTQEDRAQLMEIYMAVAAGDGGFNIVMVSGATQTTYGPGADFDRLLLVILMLKNHKMDYGVAHWKKLLINLLFLMMDYTTLHLIPN